MTPAQQEAMRRIYGSYDLPEEGGERSGGTCAPWAEPTLQVPPVDFEGGDEDALAAIAEDQERFMAELTGQQTPDWLIPLRDITSPRPPTPYPQEPDSRTYESRAVSPVSPSVLPGELELQRRILNYERELQTLHVIQGRDDMKAFIDELDDDPRREVLRAILATAALRNQEATMAASPEPLPVPNAEIVPLPTSPSPVNSRAVSTSPSPSPSPSLRTQQATDFIEAIENAPKGPSREMDLTEPGWHVSANPLRAMEIPTVEGHWSRVPATFLRYFLHYRTGEPMWEGAEGEGTGIYGEPLKAVPQPDIPQESAVDDVRDYFSPHTYFHGMFNEPYGNSAIMGCLQMPGDSSITGKSSRPCKSKSCGSSAQKLTHALNARSTSRQKRNLPGINAMS
ncbi:hypothetical protein BC826DRAFT_975616 [Russula brevipes]|nr:hypothetical protein BC826DRAFT_975616 [Russula brevipes]